MSNEAIPTDWVLSMVANNGPSNAPTAAMMSPPESGRSSKWHDVGPIDPIKAILIKNE